MKKLTGTIFLGALLATVAPASVSAQSANGTVNASATVLAYLDVQNLADLDFGTLTAGTGLNLVPGTLPGVGTLGVLQIDHNSEVALAITLPAGGLTLVGGGGGEPQLPVTFSCGYSPNSSGGLDISGPQVCTGAALGNRAGNGDGTTRTSFVQVGGSISGADTTDRIPGTYTGQITVTVTSIY